MPKGYRQRGISRSRSAQARERARHDLPVYEGEVRDLASDGRAVAVTPDGCVTFVAGAWLGERIRWRQLVRRSGTDEGLLLAVLESHPERRKPPCQYHGVSNRDCGGCAWQFVDYPAQLAAKQLRLASALQRLSVPPLTVETFPAPEEWGYRNRAQLKADGQQLGFVAARSNNLIDVHSCPVLSPSNEQQLQTLRARLPTDAWRPRGKSRWITLDIDDERGTVLLNQRQPFRQGNTAQNLKMRAWLTAVLENDSAQGKLLELFAGAGNFTEVLAGSGRPVCAVELVASGPETINAQPWAADVRTEVCDLLDESAAVRLARQHGDTQSLMLDPPRDGCPTLSAILQALPRLASVFYVSCDLATWTRDAAVLMGSGFALTAVALIDLYPQTPHLEVMTVFKRSGG